MEPEFYQVLDKDGCEIMNNAGEILIHSKKDGTQMWVDRERISFVECSTPAKEPAAVDDTEAAMDIQNETPPITNTNTTAASISSYNEDLQRYWSRAETLMLINLYKKNKELFASTSLKNNKVWQKIASEFPNHSAKQCENKFKYLRGKYLSKKDNMAATSSGAPAIHFAFYEEMDSIFRKEPIVTPVAIASSSRDNDIPDINEEHPSTSERNSSADGPRNRRNIKLKEAVVELNNILKKSEDEKNRRHKEMIEAYKESVNQFLGLMGDILQKM